MTNDEPSNAKVIGGTLVLILALAATEGLLYHLGGLLAAIAFPVIALLWWTGYRLITVPAPAGTTGNVGEPVLVERERPRADEPHTW